MWSEVEKGCLEDLSRDHSTGAGTGNQPGARRQVLQWLRWWHVEKEITLVALSIREMRSELGRLEGLVEREGEVVITRRGKPIARVIPVHGRANRPSHADLRASMPRLETPSQDLVRLDRDER